MLFDCQVQNLVFMPFELLQLILQVEELQEVPLTKCERDILVIVKHEIFQKPYRLNNASRVIFVHLLAAIDNALDGKVIMNVTDCGVLENTQNYKYSELMTALKSEQLRGSPSRRLKDAMLKVYGQVCDLNDGVDFHGYASTLHFALSLFMFNFGPTSQDTECPKISEFTRAWMTDCKEADEHFITRPLLELITQINHRNKLQLLVC